MKYGIFSDVHGNLFALEKVVEQIGLEDCDKVICLGDLVGYGPFPNECIDLTQEIADAVIVGNHDHAAIGLTDSSYFNQWAKIAVEWTFRTLTEESKKYLQQLPFHIIENGILFVHASPCEPEKWHYIMNLWEAMKNFQCFDEAVCFVGHSHIPVHFIFKNNREVEIYTASFPLHLQARNKYIINVGSVGQPRDGDAKAAYAIYDTDKNMIEIKRVAYDVEKTMSAMQQNKLPVFLIERLARGH